MQQHSILEGGTASLNSDRHTHELSRRGGGDRHTHRLRGSRRQRLLLVLSGAHGGLGMRDHLLPVEGVTGSYRELQG